MRRFCAAAIQSMTTHKDDKSQMFDSFLWDDFCKCQGATSIKKDIDPVSSGILAKLMTKNTSAEATFACIFYSDGTWDEQVAFHSFARFHVDAYPAQSGFQVYRDGTKIEHFGPLIKNNGLIPTSRSKPGMTWPHILLDFEGLPGFGEAPSLVSTLALRVCSIRTHFPLLIRATSELFHTLKKNCMPTNFGPRLLSTQSVP